jgi:3-oxoacyl-[acyl-carrier-protein] synthase-3
MNFVYITRSAKFLPNEGVSNEDMEKVLGMVGGKPSKAKAIILRNNQIKNRYYALKDGKSTHSNAEITAEAVRALLDDEIRLSDIQMLCCGTTSPDQLLPSHAAMVQGILGGPRLEIISPQSSCMAGILAMKYAWMGILSGQVQNAIAVGSDRFSAWLESKYFQKESENLQKLNDNPYIAFEKDFLRWMLSDGAGAFLLQNKPNEKGLSLRIEWMELTSYANEHETCMYVGGEKQSDGSLKGWSEFDPSDYALKTLFSIKQDTRVLGEKIVPLGVQFYVEVLNKHKITPKDFEWFLPHLSSNFFKEKIKSGIEAAGYDIPYEKWFTNLSTIGNVGSGSPFLMLEELMNSGKLKKGQHILMMVPESARFSYAYIYLTVC